MTDGLSELLAQQRETHTLLKGHVKLTDERHEDTKEQHKEFKELFKEHDERIKKGEGFRNRLIGYAVGAGLLSAGAAEIIKVKIGI